MDYRKRKGKVQVHCSVTVHMYYEFVSCNLDQRFLNFLLLRTPTESLLEAADLEGISTI
jgi:hypothetical protein